MTNEFQEYAARVSRGEALEPYRGAVLAGQSAKFPWSVAPERLLLPPAPASQRPSLAPVSVSVPVFVPASKRALYPERGRALETTLWLAGTVSSIIGVLGVGAGASNAANNGFDDLASDPGQFAQKSVAAAACDEATGSSLYDAPELASSIGERQLASLAVTKEKAVAKARPAAAAGASTRPLSPRRFSARPASAPTSSAPRLIVPAEPVPAAGELSRGVVTSARPTKRGDERAPGDGG